jgi:hypothetical protein
VAIKVSYDGETLPHVQARDLGSTRHALKKRLYGTGRKGIVPVTDKQRLAYLRISFLLALE